MNVKLVKWSSFTIPFVPVLVVLIIIFPLLPFWEYEQPSIILDFDSVQNPEISFEATTLENGDNKIHGSVYYNDYLWFSTRTNPARVLKMNPDTLEYERVVLEGLNDGEDLIATQGKIWVIVYQSKTKIITIDPETLSWTVAVELPFSEGGSLLYDFGYLWAGGNGRLARINTTDYTYTVYGYPVNQFHALSSGNGYLWGSSPNLFSSQTTILKINPSNPQEYSSVIIKKIVTDDMTYLDNALYVGSENSGGESYIYKIYDNLTYIPVTTQKRILCYGIFQNDEFLWAAYTGNPGTIIQFSNKFELINVIQLPNGYNDANEIIWDSNGNMFITCFQSPAKVVKLNIASL